MKYLKTFENYYQDMLQYYKSNYPLNDDIEEDEESDDEENLLDEDEVEANDVIKPSKKDINNSINKLNNLM